MGSGVDFVTNTRLFSIKRPSSRNRLPTPFTPRRESIMSYQFSGTAWGRREFLWHAGGGLGGIALGYLLANDGVLGDEPPAAKGKIESLRDSNPRLGETRPRARRIVQLFMNGGVSQMDTFDYKPELFKRHGEKIDFGIKAAVTSMPGAVMKSPFEWKQYGQCGRWVSSVFPHLAGCVDDLAFLMAMASKTNVHGPASYIQNTGFVLPGFPCMGAWIGYCLGSLTRD